MNHAELLIAGLKLFKGGNRMELRRRLDEAVSKFQPRHFPTPLCYIFEALRDYYLLQGFLTADVLEDWLASNVDDKEERGQALAGWAGIRKRVPEAKWRYALGEYLDIVERAELTQTLDMARDVLMGEVKDGRETLAGLDDAKSVLHRGLAQTDRLRAELMPSIDARGTADEVRVEYENTLKGVGPTGILSGWGPVDNLTHGAQAGELWLVAAWAGDGKTMALVNMAWHAAITQGLNVVMATAEMPVSQVRRRLVTRHSHHDKFGLPYGIRYDDIRNAELDDDDRDMFDDVLDDWKQGEYGQLHVFQIPHGAGLEFCINRLHQYEQLFHVDAFYLDYLTLLRPPRYRRSEFEELGDLCKSAKQMALDFNRGAGLPIITAFQTNREGWRKAVQQGRYERGTLAGTSEAERSADFILWLLQTDDANAVSEILAGVAKYRDSGTIREFRLYQDFASSYMGAVRGEERLEGDAIDPEHFDL